VDQEALVEYRYRAVCEVLGGSPIGEVAVRYGTTRQSLDTWRTRFTQEGMAGLIDRSRRPHTSPTKLDADVEALGSRRCNPAPVGELEDQSVKAVLARQSHRGQVRHVSGRRLLTSAVPAPGNPGGVAGCCTGAGCEVHVARAVMIHAAHSTLIGGSHMLLDSSGRRSQDSFTCEYQIRSATATMSSEIAEIRR
jgi:transposase